MIVLPTFKQHICVCGFYPLIGLCIFLLLRLLLQHLSLLLAVHLTAAMALFYNIIIAHHPLIVCDFVMGEIVWLYRALRQPVRRLIEFTNISPVRIKIVPIVAPPSHSLRPNQAS